ncbi:mitotic checkpoint serine/threonine-protein kinase BUB1 beta [Mixophyes fleayi]|uniref:mitotic checkpoint serine/threonine-protein kinase BUB1 beta n=1 Tax=Mixophyes fleayi TaxID=3061075 RepID=UPI003F4DF8EA
MAQAGDEWELSKENVQPLRQGRAMSTLQEVLSQQEATNHNAIQQKKQAFELELRFYSGDDPLDVWDRYIKWAEQAFPQGGKESNLSPLLERAVKIFHQEQQYYGDLRYLNMCLKFANFCTEPVDLYSYLQIQGIGILHAQLYITWAEEYEAGGNYKKADSIFLEGIHCKAEPLEKLEAHHKQFQARVSRQVLQGIAEEASNGDSDIAEPQRSSLVDLKSIGKNKARAPVSRVGEAIKPGSQGLSAPLQQIPSFSRFLVLDENADIPVTGSMATTQPWATLPTTRAKENEQKAGAWNSKRPPRRNRMSSSASPPSVPSFTPYVDELAEQQTVTPCKINPSVTSVLSSRKPCKEEDPLQRVQSSSQGKEEMVMYCKSKIYAGVEEFSFEELRAEIYMAKIRKMREEDLQASVLRRQEMERKIEEMEKQLKGSYVPNQERVTEEPAHVDESSSVYRDAETEPKVAIVLSRTTEVGASMGHEVSGPTLPRQVPYKYVIYFCHSANMTLSSIYYTASQPFCLCYPAHVDESSSVYRDAETEPKVAIVLSRTTEVGASMGHEVSGPTLPRQVPYKEDLTRTQNPFNSTGASSVLSSDVPFTIFDETCTTQLSNVSQTRVPAPKHRLLAAAEKTLIKDEAPFTDTLGDIEPLNEEAIVSGSDRTKSLFADPEDTCDFVRAAQLASTPFHKPRDEAEQSGTPGLKRLPLRETTPVCEESHRQAVCPKKLSPILEASQEDSRSSVSSVSSISAGSTSSFASKTLLVHEKLDLIAQLSGVYEQALEDTSIVVESTELHRNLLKPMPGLLTSVEIHHVAGLIPTMKDQAKVQLGGEIYHLKSEVVLGQHSRVYMGVQADFDVENMNGVALKVDSHPVPWDLYITQQLKERLGETDFLKQSNGYLFQDGCITLYKDISLLTVQDILRDTETTVEQIIILLTYNLLSLVEKLHTVEIVHGDLRPETLILDDRIFDLSSNTEMNSCLKLIDFSHSMDMRLCPTLTARTFPIAQTEHGQQILGNRTSPYQVDLLGIANVVHLTIFKENLQIHKEESTWKIGKEIPRLWRGNLWNNFFSKILNTNCESTASVLKELKDEMRVI